MVRTSFGRRAAREVADVQRLLGAHPIVTLVGPGGVGKTRLAVDAARGPTTAFPTASGPPSWRPSTQGLSRRR